MKYTIKIPQEKNGKWEMSQPNGGKLTRLTAKSVYLNLERKIVRILASHPDTKIKVRVLYDRIHKNDNETEYSSNPNYLLYLTAQFLEDYVPRVWRRKREKMYL